VTTERHAWIDASAGIAGDMLLGALFDAGASVDSAQSGVDAVLAGAVRVRVHAVTRSGLRALKADIDAVTADPPHRTWRSIRELLEAAALPERVRERALAVFARLADAEASVHGVAADDVHFHEVGALDSIADVVGVCAALEDLGVATLSAGAVAVGSGRVRTAHGELPVPVPAVLRLAAGWEVHAGGDGELEALPSMRVEAAGVGAGGRDTAGRANVVRVVLGTRTPSPEGEPAMVLEANVDDLDPRLWPGILAILLEAGAADAWLVPIVMKKGRPAHTLTVLCSPGRADELREQIFRETSTLGVRESPRRKVALERTFVDVAVAGEKVPVKVAHRDGRIVQVMPEFENVSALARRQGRPERVVLQEAIAAATAAGLTVGAPLPPD
jgi:uncharacterized protein (TIGR00299 family) protein